MATLRAMFRLFDGYSSTIDRITRSTDRASNRIVQASGNTDRFNQRLNQTGASANNAARGIGNYVSAALTIATAVKAMNISDTLVNTSARLSIINDGLQTQEQLQEKIYAAATRSRGVYTTMADAVAKLGTNAADAFGSNDELIAFAELLQKGFKVGGATSEEQSSAMLQLTQAMGSGKLQGDEFRSIMESAPMIADAIAKYVGVGKGELKELASEGMITSDIIKNAIFAAGGQINEQFAQMPITFSDVWNKIKNGALNAFSKISSAVTKIINSEGFMNVINGLIIGINILGSAIGGLIDFIVAGWDIIGPFVIGLATTWLYGIIASLWAMVPPLIAQAAAWLAINWPMILVIALIVLVIQTLVSLGVTFQDVFAFVGGLLGVFYAAFANVFILIYNIVADFINFFGNVFKNPIASIKSLFLDMAVSVLGIIEGLAQGIEDLLNKIPGVEVSLTGGISGLKDSLAAKSASIKDEAGLTEFVQKKDYINYSAAASSGSSLGLAAYDKVSTALSGITDQFSSLTNGTLSGGAGTGLTGMDGLGTASNPLTVEGTGNGGKIDVDMADEDLKYLRDVAEREYVNKFSNSTLAPQVSIQFGDVRETADVDQVAKRISTILQEQIAVAGEGLS